MTTSTANPGLPATAFGSVFQALGGLRNGRALVALLGSLVVGIVVSMMAGWLGVIGALFGALFMFVAVGTGVNAAGVILMDQARGSAPRSLGDALVYGLMCIPKLILLGLGLLAVAIAVFIVIALAFLVCKIPYLGPLLFVVAFPVSVIVAGATVFGLFVCLVLALPAIWEGLSVMRALSQTLAIARARLVDALLLLAALWFLSLLVGFIVFGIAGAGLMPTFGLAASILGGGSGGMGSMFGVMPGGAYGGMGGIGGGYMVGGMVGAGVIWALATTLIGLVWLLGLNIVYLRLTEGLDVSATEDALRRGFDDAKRRTAELGEAAKAKAAAASAAASAAARQRTSAPAPSDPPADLVGSGTVPPPASAPASPPTSEGPRETIDPSPRPTFTPPPLTVNCPSCSAACSVDDVYCGVCGQRLK